MKKSQENLDDADVAFVCEKLQHTIEGYAARFPELMFLSSGIDQVQQLNGAQQKSLQALEELHWYMQNKLSAYYVIQIMDHDFQHDIDSLQKGWPVSRGSSYYLASL